MNDELRAKLTRLRRESARGATPAPEADVLPDWLSARLARGEVFAAGGERSLDAPAGLEEARGVRGSFALRRELFDGAHAHGDWPLADALAASSAELAWLARDPALLGLDPATAVYLDIETTGLAGGAGTIPFLVALGRFVEGRFELWQAFLREPGEEAAALAEVAERIRAASGVVSFFGKSFDRHRLEDKMRLHRIVPPFSPAAPGRTALPHLDLYYPLRRLYRSAFESTRLATFEHELCGVARGFDLPGSHAPEAWFDFLAGRAHRLEGVFRHNALDVLSLVVLLAHLARARRETRDDGAPLAGCGRARARALAELHAQQHEHDAALAWLERALTRPGSDEGALWFRHAELLAKKGERPLALEEFLRLARERDDALGARAWREVLRLARRLKIAELEREALQQGRAAVERILTGRARARALAPFERSAARAPS